MADQSLDQEISAVAEALAGQHKILLTTHIKPDADALGSLLAMHRALTGLGKDSVMYLSDGEGMAPEYRFLRGLDQVLPEPPADYAERALCALDCGNAERIGDGVLLEAATTVINIDHHGDNTRFGDINLVDGSASSTAEIVYRILERMGAGIDEETAEDLYTGILVDSGRFQYSSATPATFRVAAELIDRGVDHARVFRIIYETVPLAKTRLLCRMFARLQLACDGRLAIGVLEQDDFEQAGAEAGMTEGLVDSLRAIEGVEASALIYRRPAREGEEPGAVQYRVSLRSSSEAVNVQALANIMDGGGHRQAAGFSSDKSAGELASFIIGQVSAQLGLD
ncbi:MAG: bifunctional oligoribonuclease/PAP phosphatase NrnA [Gaiellales bacterium]|nr:MAG: bifunctional oligoribonuclease/PAP phosphatase NrnA [Gaiellales bacterium]